MILFEVACGASPGEAVAVLGSGPLGAWDLDGALLLQEDRAGLWSGHVMAPPGGVDFRYAVVDARGQLVRWEADVGCRTADPHARNAEIIALRHVFGDLAGGSVELMRCNSCPSSGCCDAMTDASTHYPSSSATLAASEGDGLAAGGAVPESGELVLQTLQVDPSVRFGRFSHTPGAFEEKYELDGETVLGTGMSGGVLAARSKATGAQVAVKTLCTEGLDEKQLDRVMAEVENQLMMDHPNIARLLEVFEEPGRVHLVMERLQGPDLFEHLARTGRYTERAAAICVRQMVAAVAYCHRNGVCHRDLKLENFCLEDDSEVARVKLIDFGLSSLFEDKGIMTHACGTLCYVAPEVLRNRYDQKCDVWSLGVIAYILLDGRPPFFGKDDRATYMNIKRGEYDFPPERWGHVSSLGLDFVASLLEVEVAKRLDIEEALSHPWLAAVVGESYGEGLGSLDPCVLDSMRSFSKSNALKRAVLRAISPAATVERASAWVAHFDALDEDGDGKVSIKVLAQGLIDHGGLSKVEADRLSAELAGADGNSDLVSYSSFLSSCLYAHMTLDDEHLRSLFHRLDGDNSGVVSLEDVRKALGDLVDIECLRNDFAGQGLTYSDFRWLMSTPGFGPTILGWQHLLGASSSVERSWKHSTKVAKRVVPEADATQAARRENMAWRVMYMSVQRGRHQPRLESSKSAPPPLDAAFLGRASPAKDELDAWAIQQKRATLLDDFAERCFLPVAALQRNIDGPVEATEYPMHAKRSRHPAREDVDHARIGATSIAVRLQSEADELSAWQCATIAAKDGCMESARVENMRWRSMHLRRRRRSVADIQ